MWLFYWDLFEQIISNITSNLKLHATLHRIREWQLQMISGKCGSVWRWNLLPQEFHNLVPNHPYNIFIDTLSFQIQVLVVYCILTVRLSNRIRIVSTTTIRTSQLQLKLPDWRCIACFSYYHGSVILTATVELHTLVIFGNKNCR